MCDPVSLTIGGFAVSTALSLYGSQQSAKAASSAARATEASNLRTQTAQNEAFSQRMGAASRQTDAQTAVMRQTMQDRLMAAQGMRDAQGRAHPREPLCFLRFEREERERHREARRRE